MSSILMRPGIMRWRGVGTSARPRIDRHPAEAKLLFEMTA